MDAEFVITIRRIPRIIITFAKNLGVLKTNIIKIGNSRGIVIPGKLLARLGLDIKDTVNLDLENGRLIVSAIKDPFEVISCGGWYTDSRDSHDISDELFCGRINTRESVEI